jgi:hypothetical protein
MFEAANILPTPWWSLIDAVAVQANGNPLDVSARVGLRQLDTVLSRSATAKVGLSGS